MTIQYHRPFAVYRWLTILVGCNIFWVARVSPPGA